MASTSFKLPKELRSMGLLPVVGLLVAVSCLGVALVILGKVFNSSGGDGPTIEAPAPMSVPAMRLRHVAGSTARIEQLIGDYDVTTGHPTANQSAARYGIVGTDLGYSFEHNGRVYFLFGDTIGPGGGDAIGYTESSDPNAPMQLDFLLDAQGQYRKFALDGVNMDGYNVPVGGISLDGVVYVAVKTNNTARTRESVTLLTRYDLETGQATFLRELARVPDGRFITTAMKEAPAGLPGLPGEGRYVLIFGSGQYRRSHAYLMAVPAATFETGEGTRYFAGLEHDGVKWSHDPEVARPIIEHETIGDLSVTYVPQLDTWVALYDSREPRGVVLRYAARPWGPWSEAQLVWHPERDPGYGSFIYDPDRPGNQHLAGPTIVPGRDPQRVGGGVYAPYIIERFTRVEGPYLTLDYVLSTWNPYVVVRMRSSLYMGP